MTISTEDCKDFILSISHVINANPSDKWKRTKKYKENSFFLRDFENQDSRTLTISEVNGQLSLYSLSAHNNMVQNNNISIVPGEKLLTKKLAHHDIFEFIADCIQKDTSIVYEDEDTVTHALNPKSWTIWQYWSDEKTPKDPSSEEDSLASFLDSSDDFHLALHYPVNDDYTYEYIDKKDIKQVFWIGMPDYDTAYRIFIFHTKDNKLILGQNEPD